MESLTRETSDKVLSNLHQFIDILSFNSIKYHLQIKIFFLMKKGANLIFLGIHNFTLCYEYKTDDYLTLSDIVLISSGHIIYPS